MPGWRCSPPVRSGWISHRSGWCWLVGGCGIHRGCCGGRVLDQFRAEFPGGGVAVREEAGEPVVGAVLLAMDVGEMPSGFAVRDRIVATLPGRELFET